MLQIDEEGNILRNNDHKRICITNADGKKVDAVHSIGLRYCIEAVKALGRDAPKNPLLLREGAGKLLLQRLRKYGAQEVVRRLKLYMDSDKFREYPRLTAALSSDTFVKIETGKL